MRELIVTMTRSNFFKTIFFCTLSALPAGQTASALPATAVTAVEESTLPPKAIPTVKPDVDQSRKSPMGFEGFEDSPLSAHSK